MSGAGRPGNPGRPGTKPGSKDVEDVYGLSPMQEGLLFESLYAPESAVYVVQLTLGFEHLDEQALLSAWELVRDRHAVLRTAFAWKNLEKPLAIVGRTVKLPVERLDWRGLSPSDLDSRLSSYLEADRRKGFDLSKAPLMRLALIRVGEERHYCAWSFHHILLDGWSTAILLREVLSSYYALRDNRRPTLPRPFAYRDYVDWLERQDPARARAFWSARLSDLERATRLGVGRRVDESGSERRKDGSRALTLSAEESSALSRFARASGLTLSTVVHGAFALLSSRYSGEERVAFGTAVSGRECELEGIESAVGLLMNTLPLRVRVEPRMEVVSWLRDLQQELAAMRDVEWSPLLEVQRASGVPRGEPLFESILGFENYPVGNVADGPVAEGAALRVSKVEYFDNTHYPLALMINPADRLRMRASFDERAFTPDSVERLLQHLASILSAFASRPEGRLEDVPVLPEAERAAVLRAGAGARRAIDGIPVHQQFERKAAEAPDALAVASSAGSIPYRELDRRANALAHLLRSRGVGPEVPVGLAMERSIEMIVGVLGTLKAGGAYVSLEVSTPRERLNAMLREVGAPVVLTDRSRIPLFEGLDASTVALDEELGAADAPPPARIDPSSLAYVIFTSGSTGKPKAVGLTHRGLANLVGWHVEAFGIGADDRATQLAGLGFDASVWEMWPYLASGASLFLPDEETKLVAPDLLAFLAAREITVAFLPTALAEAVLEQEMPKGLRLRALLTGGDKLHRGPREGLPFRLFNHYGPTESTVVTSWCEVAASATGIPDPPIGRTITNIDGYVLDGGLSPCPWLVPGELYVGGAGVARGYLGCPDLTAERFVPDPFSREPGARMYATGDIVRLLPDGNLEFVGRRDHQVKVRGQRIELGEVEAALARHPAVRDAVVALRQDETGSERLVGYVVPRERNEEANEERAALDDERVLRWRRTYDEVVYTELDEPGLDPTFNTRGWDSTFTGLPISAEGMREQVRQTVDRVVELAPDRLLEIGCGTGMLLFELAPRVSRYVATDFSRAALDHVERNLSLLGEARSSVSLHQKAANDFEGIEPESFDLVLMNSVVQYFPGVDYLVEVLEGAVRSVRDGGHVVLGDLRHLELLPAFHAAVQMHRLPAHHSTEGLLARIRESVEAEQELAVSPDLFFALKRRIPRISGTLVRPKRGRDDNELARFRYDVVLRIGGEAPSAIEARKVVFGREVKSLSDVVALLEAGAPALRVEGIFNRRVHAGVAALEALQNGAAPPFVGALREWAEREAEARSVDPEDAWALAERHSCEVQLGWSRPSGDGAFDLLLQPRGEGRIGWISESSAPRSSWREYGNDPLRGSAARGLVPRLREFLSERLPEAMVPTDFVLLDELPLNASGKVDRRSLPAPEKRGPGLDSGYVAPRGPIEEGVASIWKDLLKVERIGAHDDFFELGGHSLLATSVVTRIRDAFQIDLPLRSLFEAPTVAGLAERIERTYREDEAAPPLGPILAKPRGAEMELSFAQARLWFLSRLDPSSPAYNVHAALRLRGALDAEALEESLRAMVRRHESLRTTFGEREGRPFQRVGDEDRYALARVDLRASSDPEADARAAAREEASRPFDLETGPLFRTTLLELAPDDHVLLLTMHHIVSDGWSIGVFFREWGALYAALSSGRPALLPELPVQYADFARWQREWLDGEVLERQLGFWTEALKGLSPLELPTDRPRPATRTYRGGRRTIVLPAALSSAVRELSHREGATLFMTLLALYQVLLFRYTGQEDVAVGTPIAGRNRREIEGLIGFFVNTLVLRTDLSGRPSFRELVARVRESALSAFAHQDLPFEKLVEEISPQRNLGQNPLFQTIFAFQNAPIEGLSLPGLTLEGLEVESGATRFDLEMHVRDRLDGIRITVSYNRDLFEEATIERLLGHYRSLVDSAVASPKAPVADLEMLSDSERRELLDRGVGDESDVPRAESIASLFETRSAETPDAIAVVCEDREVSYRELNRRANRVGRALRAAGARRGDVVAIAAARSEALIAGLLGILKAGAAYLPLDPGYPAERLRFMLEDSAVRILLADESTAALLPAGDVSRVLLDAPEHEGLESENLDEPTGPADLAYVIYTSGSTGIPKGVEVPHRAVLRLLFGVDYVRFGRDKTLLALAPISFDASTFEIWGALLHGGRLVVYGEKLAAPEDLRTIVERERVTTLWLTSSLFNAVVDSSPRALTGLSELLTGGEALSVPHVRKALAAMPELRLVNGYGPTEGTTFTCCHPIVKEVPEGASSIPIGTPIGNTRVYVLDSGMRPVPVGVPGELFIGGDGLARGYRNRPDLTAEKFVPDPFPGVSGAKAGGRLYRTGDRVRWLPDGTLEFLGRRDQQVKIHGFRIEPGEIEAALLAEPSVEEAVVICREDVPGEKRLVAYVVGGADSSRLRERLAGRLPAYMVPASFVPLSALPLSPNGKVDREKLPAPAAAQDEPALRERALPRTKIESAVASVWRDLLRREELGVHDNFFELGGHSLLILQVHARLREIFPDRKLSVTDLFRYPTIAGLAAHLAGSEGPAPSEEPASRNLSGRIAIIGMSGRFPGARDVDELWRNLCEGRESITFFSEEETELATSDRSLLKDPSFVRAGGVLEGADLFDAEFFGYNPREAAAIDPQQRVFLETAWEALERAGYADESTVSVGVFAGSSGNSYFAGGGGDRDFLATRVSYKLNLRGPSVNVQTACSTSLVAVHLACQSLRAGECDIALAGGVSVRFPQKSGYRYEKEGITSPDGHCRAFDERAEGTVGGNGVGVVVLKRLEDAIRDRDSIEAVIAGSAINNDGSNKVGFTAPGVSGQAAAVRAALANAGFEPGSIGYVECHGTGTALGDPIEIEALREVFGEGRGPATCAIASLKTNIGHLDAAAGVSGLIKAALVLRHGKVPRSLHFERPSPRIGFDGSPFFVPTELVDFPASSGPRRAGVSSFGIGGTNAHAVLEEAPPSEPAPSASKPELLVLSAKTASALSAQSRELSEYLGSHPDVALEDVAYTLANGRRRFPFRRAIVCETITEAREKLATPDFVDEERRGRGVVFLFPGQGAQYPGMAEELYRSEAAFRGFLDEVLELLRPELGCDPRALLYPNGGSDEENARRLRETAVAQPILFALEVALGRFWISRGIEPSAMIGHSLGEYAAACLASVLPLEEAVALVMARGRLMQARPPGEMLSVALGEPELGGILPRGLSLAAVNAPSLSVVSGPVEAIAAFERLLAAKGVAAKRLHTSHAFHSAMMDEALEPFARVVEKVNLRAPSIPIVSNLTGTWIRDEEATDPRYWVRHLRETVRFSDGVAAIASEGDPVFLELGPGETLSTLVRQVKKGASCVSTSAGALEALGRLWSAGVDVNWRKATPRSARRIPLPTYPFERRRYWLDAGPAPRKTGARTGLEDWFYVPSWKRSTPKHGASDGVWLLLGDEGPELAARLRSLGRTALPVALAEVGTELARAEGPVHVVHLGAHPGEGRRSFDPWQANGTWSLVTLCRVLEKVPRVEPTVLHVVTSEVQEVFATDRLSPAKATLAGFLKVVPQELPWIRVSNVDVPPDSGIAGDDLVRELLIESPEPVIALRGGERWVQSFERVVLPRPESAPPVKEGAVYLITGGLGFVGFMLARHLVRSHGAKVILVGRSAPDPSKLEALGAGAFYARADVADEIALRAAIEEGESRLGPVRGLVHAAGVTSGSSFRAIRDLRPEDFAAQYGPKVDGLRALDRILGERDLDFALLTSSLSVHLGGLGFAAYAAANSFLDAYAFERGRSGRTRWISVAWDGFFREDAAAGFGMTPDEALESFDRILAGAPSTRVVVSTGDLDARRAIGAPLALASAAGHARPDSLRTEYSPPSNDLERSMVEAWQTLLGYERVGVDDDFFELGGHSLLATQVVSRLRALHGIALPLRAFFEERTPRKLARRASRSVEEAIPRAPRDRALPLSFAQHRMWFLDALEPGNPTYNWWQVIRLRGPLDESALAASLARIVERHEILRTTIAVSDEGPVQVVHPPAELRLQREDLRSVPRSERESEAERRVRAEVRRPFDLTAGPIFRPKLLRLDDEDHLLVLAMHHVATDGWSSRVLMRELQALYRSFTGAGEESLPELRIQYADYAAWQRERLSGEALEEQLAYWRARLEGIPSALDLPTDRPRPRRSSHRGAKVERRLPEPLTRSLRELSQRRGATLFMTLLAAFKALLSRYTGETDIAVGTPIANRERAELEGLIGFFLNTLVLRTDLSGDPSFEELLDREKETCLGAYAHQEIPFESLVEELSAGRDLSRTPFFQVFFNLLNLEPIHLELPALAASGFAVEVESAKFDLTLYVQERGAELLTVANYDCDLFDPETVERMLRQYEKLLEQLVAEPQAPVSRHSIRGDEDGSLLPDPSQPLERVELENTVVRFERIAAQFPDRPALRRSGREHTYRDLACAASGVTKLLLRSGFRPGEVIAIAGSRGLSWVASVLAVMRSGGVMLALDSRLPRERQAGILRSAGASRILHSGERGRADEWLWTESGLPVIEVGDDPRSEERIDLPVPAGADPAYLFFTSGSTGEPKGILGAHEGLSHFISWQRETFEIGPEDRVAQLTSPSFDAILRDLFLPLSSGASLVLPDEGMDLGADRVLAWLDREAVTVVHTVPTLAETWVADAGARQLSSLRYLFFSGEALRSELIAGIREKLSSSVRIVNLYGPTETTMTKSFHLVPDGELEAGVVPIGRPMPQTQLLVIGEGGRLCAVGEVGEIAIRTPYRTLGYWNAPEGARGFTRNPFRDDPEDLLYFTGDLGRLHRGGNLHYLGRRDGQVKVRGARVEPSEVEQVLNRHPDVRQSAVIGRAYGNETRLVAYVIPRPGSSPSSEELKRHLSVKLPEYMVPWAYVTVEAFPRTASGKLDRRALPAPEASAPEPAEHVAPRTPVEEELAAIWRELLALERVSVRDDFFRLGGHSLLVTRLLARARQAFGVELPLRAVFETPTIEGLALAVTEARMKREDEAEMLRLIAEIKALETAPRPEPPPRAERAEQKK